MLDAWKEPLEWQRPRPDIFVRDQVIYVSDPAGRLLHAVDFASGEVTSGQPLPQAPNELTGT